MTNNVLLSVSMLSVKCVQSEGKVRAVLQIAEHVLGQHMYRAAGEDGHSTISDAQER